MMNTKQKQTIRRAMITAGVYVIGMMTIWSASAATTATFDQTSWSGSASTSVPVEPTNRAGWTNYQTKQSTTAVVNAGADLQLQNTSITFTQSGDGMTETGFNATGSVFASTTMSGAGADAKVVLDGARTNFSLVQTDDTSTMATRSTTGGWNASGAVFSDTVMTDPDPGTTGTVGASIALPSGFTPGAVDLSFSVNLSAMMYDPQQAFADDVNYIYAGGAYIDSATESYRTRVLKIKKADGSLETAFGGDGKVDYADGASRSADYNLSSIAIDGTYIYVMMMNSSSQYWVEKWDKTTGALVASSAKWAYTTLQPYEMQVDASGVYLVGTQYLSSNYQWRVEKRSLSTLGLVSGFGSSGVKLFDLSYTTGSGEAATLGKVDSTGLYVYGYYYATGGVFTKRIIKIDLATGAYVTAFGVNGILEQTGITPFAMATDATHLYIAGGSNAGTQKPRYEKRNKTTGALDTTFNGTGYVDVTEAYGGASARGIDIDGSYIYGRSKQGGLPYLRIERRSITTGALDTTFGTGGYITTNGFESDRAYFVFADADAIYDYSAYKIEKRFNSAVSGYPASGTYASGMDAGTAGAFWDENAYAYKTYQWDTLSWQGSFPAGTTIDVSVGSGATPGYRTSSCTVTGQASSGSISLAACQYQYGRYLSYTITLKTTSSAQTPTIESLSASGSIVGAKYTTGAYESAPINIVGKTLSSINWVDMGGYTQGEDTFSSDAWTEGGMTGSVANGIYSANITNVTDPYMEKGVSIYEAYKGLQIKYKSYAGGPSAIKLYWVDGGGYDYYGNPIPGNCNAYAEACSQSFPIIADGNWHVLNATISASTWNGQSANKIRIDFEGATATGVIDLDFMRVNNDASSRKVDMKVRTFSQADKSDAPAWDSCAYVAKEGMLIDSNCVDTQDTYLQYRAFLRDAGSTYDYAELTNVSLVYSGYAATGNLESSVYDTVSTFNGITGLTWSEDITMPAGTGVSIAVRTGNSTSTLAAAAWSSEITRATTGCTKTSGVVTCGASAIPEVYRDGSNDRYVQYRVTMTSTGAFTPTVGNVKVQYAYNVPPAIASLSASQVATSSDANFGKVKINFALRDTDSTTLKATTTFEYSTNGGSTWNALTTGQLKNSDGSAFNNNVTVATGSDTAYSAYWDVRQYLAATSTATFKVRMTAIDGDVINGSASSTSANTSVDTIAPTGAITVATGAYASSTSVTVNVSATDTGAGVGYMQFSNDGSTWGATTTYATSATWSIAAGEGAKTISARFIDAVGNISATVTATTTLDTTAPTGSVSVATFSTSTAQLTLSATDANAVAKMQFANEAGAYSALETYATSKSWVLSAGDGTKTINVKFVDAAGNVSSIYTATTTVDTTAPTGSITINAGATHASSTSVSLGLSATDANGVAQMQFSNDGTSWSVWETYATTKAYTASSTDGTKTVYVRFKDTAGNISANASDNIILDTTAPVATVRIANDVAYVTGTSVSVNVTASDAGAGVAQMQLSNDDITYGAWQTYTGTSTWDLVAGDGTKTVYVRLSDSIGNISTSITDTVVLDTGAPTGSIMINGGVQYATSTDMTVTVSASDAGTGVAQMRFSDDNTTWSAWEAYAITKVYTVSAGDVEKTIYAQFKDNAGNVSTSTTDTITLDVTAPTGTVSINGGAEYATAVAVTLDLSATDAVSGMHQMQFSNDGITYGSWQAYAATAAWETAVAEGARTVYARFKDAAGNVSAVAQDTIDIDTNIPTGTMIINGGATYATSTSVALALSATDSGSGIAQMSFSENGTTWGSWEAYATTKTHTIPAGDGAKTVYVRYKDTAGNVSENISASIALDTEAPTVMVTVGDGAIYATSTSVSVALAASDANGVAQMQFSNDGTNWSTWEVFATTSTWTIGSANGEKFVFARVRDGAGNVSSATSDTITLDTQKPLGMISIEDGATYATSTTATILVSASDTSGVAQMQFSNDNSNWSEWEAYAETKEYTFSVGDGAKTVYAKFKDNAGNISLTVNDGIILDSTSPTLATTAVLINGSASPVEASAATVAVSLQAITGNPVGESVQVQLSHDGSVWYAANADGSVATTADTWGTAFASNGAMPTWNWTLAARSETVAVRVRDSLGNGYGEDTNSASYNITPAFEASIVAQQSTSTETFNKVVIPFAIIDADTSNNTVTPTVRYASGGGAWNDIDPTTLTIKDAQGATVTGDLTVASSTYTTYTAIWDAAAMVVDTVATMQVKVEIDDHEAIKNVGVATTTVTIDTKAPTLTTDSMMINGSTDLVVTETKGVTLQLQHVSAYPAGEAIQAQFSRDGGATWYGNVGGIWTQDAWGAAFDSDAAALDVTTFDWTLASRSETVTARVRDIFGNMASSTDDNSAGYNLRPEFQSASAVQVTDAGSEWYGKVKIDYTVRDQDTAEGVTTPGAVTPSIAYSVDNGVTWTELATSSASIELLASTDGTQAVGTEFTTPLSAIWNAKIDMPQMHVDAMIKVMIDDNEAIFNTASATTTTFTIDATDPAINTARYDARTQRLMVALSDEGAFQYRLSEYAEGATSTAPMNSTDAQWIDVSGSMSQSHEWTTASSTNPTIHLTVRDGAGNIARKTIVAPRTPDKIDFADISKANLELYKEFISWPTHVNVEGSTFRQYQVERSTDGVTFENVATTTSVLQAYYLDSDVASSTEYTYRVMTVDTDNDTSAYSPILTDVPDGRGSSDSNAPVITEIVATPRSTAATITWTTDEDADSEVWYHRMGEAEYAQVASSSIATRAHTVVITGLVPDTQYGFKVVSRDTNLNRGELVGSPFMTTAGPYITQIRGVGNTDKSVTITWHTNKQSDTLVQYSIYPSFNGYTEVWGATEPVGEASTTQDFVHTVSIGGLSAGTTYYYNIRSTDEQGNETVDDNGGMYHRVQTTSDIYPPVISQITVPIRTSESVAIFWKTNEPATSQVRYGSSSSTLDKASDFDDTLSTYHSVTLDKLEANTTYAFQVMSRDNAYPANEAVSTTTSFATTKAGEVKVVTIGGATGQFDTPPEAKDTTPPVISNIQIATTTPFGATITFETSEPTSMFVEYGKDAKYGLLTGGYEPMQRHTIAIAGLKMGTDYHYRVRVSDKAGNTVFSEDQTFKTKYISQASPELTTVEDIKKYEEEVEQTIESVLPGILPPFVEEPRVVTVTEDTADITWKTNIKSYAVILYAKESDFDATRANPYTGEISHTEMKETGHHLTLVGLEPNTKYHFMVRSFSLPQVVGSSQDMTFTTKASKVSARILGVKNTAFSVVWSTQDAASTIVEYKNLKTGEIQRKIDNTTVKEHEVTVDRLIPGATYEVRVFGYNEKGNLIEGGDSLTVTTIKDAIAPRITNFKVDGALVPGRTDRIQTVVTWATDELANSTVYYQEGAGAVGSTFANKAEQLDTYTTNHAVILSNLKPGTIYQMKIESVDAAGNKASFGPRTIITPQKGESIFDVIFKNFEDTFKFLRGAGQ